MSKHPKHTDSTDSASVPMGYQAAREIRLEALRFQHFKEAWLLRKFSPGWPSGFWFFYIYDRWVI